VFAKTNHCCETAAICRQHYQREILHTKSSRPQSQSIISCDQPCRNPTAGRTEDSVRFRKSAVPHEYAGKSETEAEARDTEIAGNAFSEGGKSNDVASAAGTQLHVVNSARELLVDNKHEQFRATELSTG